jgi:hypothetical protein
MTRSTSVPSTLLALLLLTFAAAAAPGCAAEEDLATDEAELPDGDDGKADGDTELRVRTGETTLWVDKSIVRETRDGSEWLVLDGRTSRNLTDGFGFVFDDPYGAFEIRSARTFDLRWSTTELASLLVGVNQYLRLQFVPSAGRPDSLTARVVARARMTDFSGSGSYIFTDVTPVVSGGRSVMRVQGSATSDIQAVTVELGGTQLSDVRITDPRHFQIDLLMDHAIAMVGSGLELEVSVRTASGNRIKRAKMALVVKKLGLTSADAYEVWPPPSCTDEVQACLEALPAGTTDLGSCGEAIEVNACGGATSVVSITDVEIVATLAQVDALLADPAGFAADAATIVGAGRVDQLVEGVHQTIEGHLEQLYGTVYPDAAERAAALQGAIDRGFDAGYAHPLDFVAALTPIPNDPVRAREIATDGLIAHLGAMDLTQTEYGRSLEELTRTYRSTYLTDLRYWRTEAVPEEIVGWPPYLFIGRMFGSHTEISVTQSTGELASVLFEID